MGFDTAQEVPLQDLCIPTKLADSLKCVLFQTLSPRCSGDSLQGFAIFRNLGPFLDRAFGRLHMILDTICDVGEGERLDRAMGIAGEYRCTIGHSFHSSAVPLERRKNRREVAEERRGRSSRTEGDLAYADFGDVHLRNPSAQCVRQQLMSQTDTEERLLSFADPRSDGRFFSDEPRILTFLPDVHRAAE